MAKVANRMLTIKFESEKDPSQTRTQEIEGFFRPSFVTRIDLTLGDSLLFRQKKPGAAEEKLPHVHSTLHRGGSSDVSTGRSQQHRGGRLLRLSDDGHWVKHGPKVSSGC